MRAHTMGAAALAAILILAAAGAVQAQKTEYLIGTSIYDITGPAAQINMMGYANPTQTTKGIHTRLYARAYVIVDAVTAKRIAFVHTDLQGVTELIHMKVIERLQPLFNGLYNYDNVGLTGTHTHAGPGGYSQYVLLEFTSAGFVEQNFEAIVNGIVQSIRIAHNNVRPGRLYEARGDLLDASINRSPYAYDQNPEEEKARYATNVDLEMTLIKAVDEEGTDLGLINWFAVHATSMNNTNRLISSDNKGYAQYLFEEAINGNNVRPGSGKFVASFCSSNLGDVSPNTKGAKCVYGPDLGLDCDYRESTCPNDRGLERTQPCHGVGPANGDDKENTRIIGERHFVKARDLYKQASTPITGSVDSRLVFVRMEGLQVTLPDGQAAKLCAAAMGYSFAAGATDGPGFFTFHQGILEGKPFWDGLVSLIKEPSEELRACQGVKPILLPTGEARLPHLWHPKILPLQILKVGQLIMIMMPGEITTMAGRRLRETVAAEFRAAGLANPLVVISGLSNTYSHYITTKEEYQVQRYEGASVLFGPNTLLGYQQEFAKIARAIATNTTTARGPLPPDFSEDLISRQPKVRPDYVPDGSPFGSLIQDVASSYLAGDVATAVFWGTNPRNDLQIGKSFFDVEINNNGVWEQYRSDADWETEFRWEDLSGDQEEYGISEVTLKWFIPTSTNAGQYRLRYNGHSLSTTGVITPFSGFSSSFIVA